MDDLTDRELKLVIKSLSITYDSLSNKMSRLKGRHLIDAVAEAELCDELLAKYKAEQASRWHTAAS
ncbi:MAG TPA: hypothetical protein VFX15_00125 [Actinomycetes bacterium]|nr:hypothetical protein [Actinomycetes bacterium]